MNLSRIGRSLGVVLAAAAASALASCGGAGMHAAAPQIPAGESKARSRAIASNPSRTGHLGATLTSKDGGQIFGYDIAQDNDSGILSTAAHVETFDQSTGAITGSFPKTTPARTTYAMDGIFAGDLALVTRYVMPKGSIFATRYYDVVAPFTAGKFTGKWTPPVFDADVQQGATDIASSTSVLFAIELKNADVPILFVSDIANNTFGKVIHLDPNKFTGGDAPQLSSYVAGGKAVFALSPDGGAVGGAAPINVLVDIATGATTQFTGFNFGPFGAGYVNGAATDPNTGIEATTTELNAQVEFYNVKTHAGVAAVQLPCTGDADQSNSGAGVAVDPAHKLFLVADPQYACDGSRDGAVVVYDEHGHMIEAINGFKFFIAEPAPIINSSKRMGWMFGPQFDQLRQFFY